MAVAIFELLNLIRSGSHKTLLYLSITGGIIILSGSFAYAQKLVSPAEFILLCLIVLFVLVLFSTAIRSFFKKYIYAFITVILYIIMPLSLVPFLVFTPASSGYQPGLVLSVFIIIWAYDSFAYLAGVSTGKHKMFPSLSPKKTWEGFAGGIIFAVASALIISSLYPVFSKAQWVMLSLLISLTGTAGDLFESSLKRKAGIKDSGNWLPGHGGVLDRFDSFLFAIPFVFIFVKFLT